MRRVRLLLLLGMAALGGGLGAQPWVFEPVGGLPHNTVSALLQDQRGFLWIGTADGLARYDGRQVRVFQRQPGAGALASNTIQALAETLDGGLWVGTSAGACRLVDEATGQFRCLSPQVDVLDLFAVGDDVWAVTIEGAWRLDAARDTFERVRIDGGLRQTHGTATTRFATRAGEVWAAQGVPGARVVRLHRADASRGRFSLSEESPIPPGHVGVLAEDGHLLTLPSVPFEAVAEGTPVEGWNQLGRAPQAADATGLWVGSDLGLFRRAGASVEHVEVGDATPFSRAVLSLTVDRVGAVWVGTRSGLYVHDPARARFAHLDPADAGAGAPVMAIETDAVGDRWVGTLGGGLVRQRPGEPARAVPHPDAVVWALHATADALWVGADGGLCRRTDRGVGACLREPLARTDGQVFVYDLEPDGADGLWVGGSTLALVDAQTGGLRRRVEVDAIGTLTVLHRDPRGRLWVGFEKRGLWRLDTPDGELRRVPIAGLEAASVWSMEDARDGVWLGTSEGLFHLDAAVPRAVPHALDLPGSTVYGVLADGPVLWLSTGRGLARYRPGDGALRVFGTDDGVRNVEFNRRAVHRDPSGRVHVGGLRGVTSFIPAAFGAEPPPPATVVTRLRVGSRAEARLAGPAVRLGPSARVIAFDVAAPLPTGAASLRFAYRLVPLDTAWVEVEGDVIRFAGLAPGRYTFQARASRGDGAWGPPATIAVTLAPPWYRTPWFLGVVALALAAGTWRAVQVRIRAVRRDERMRWRIASDLHDDIGSGLASVALLAEHVRDRSALAVPEARQLTAVARSARSMVESLREIVWFVDPAHDHPGAFATHVREAAATIVGPRATVDAPSPSRLDGAPLSFRRDVFLVLKEALHNAARHADGAAVRVRLEDSGGAVVLSVRDDGPGFDPHSVRPGTGLRSLRRRAESLGGTLDVASAPGAGTTITLSAPMP